MNAAEATEELRKHYATTHTGHRVDLDAKRDVIELRLCWQLYGRGLHKYHWISEEVRELRAIARRAGASTSDLDEPEREHPQPWPVRMSVTIPVDAAPLVLYLLQAKRARRVGLPMSSGSNYLTASEVDQVAAEWQPGAEWPELYAMPPGL